jgi:hypothetical protein
VNIRRKPGSDNVEGMIERFQVRYDCWRGGRCDRFGSREVLCM